MILGVLDGVRIYAEKWGYLGISDGGKLDGSREGVDKKSADKWGDMRDLKKIVRSFLMFGRNK